MRNKIWRTVCIWAGILVFICSGCAREDKPVDNDPPAPVEDQQKPVVDEQPSTEEEPPVDEQPEQTATVVPPETVPEKTQPENTKPFWQSEATRQMNNLIAVAAAGQTDYKMNGSKRGWMSKGGRLYNYYEGKYITIDSFVADGYLESGLNAEDYIMLLVEGSDLAQMEGAAVPSGSMDFGVFAAMKQSGKYVIASPEGKAGTLSEESYQALLDQYSQSNGGIVRLSSAAAEYDRILNYISLFEGRFDDYYVREIRRDNRHAVVIFSNRTDTSNIKEYILENENGFWEVVLPNAQTEYYPITSINRYIPTFNPELLPPYTLASWRGQIVQEQGGAVAALFSARAITSESEIVYQCATKSCAYVILQNGNRYACYQENGIWKAEYVTSDYNATRLFLEKTGVHYGFLVLDD